MDEQITLYTNDVRPSLITESFPADLEATMPTTGS